MIISCLIINNLFIINNFKKHIVNFIHKEKLYILKRCVLIIENIFSEKEVKIKNCIVWMFKKYSYNREI